MSYFGGQEYNNSQFDDPTRSCADYLHGEEDFRSWLDDFDSKQEAGPDA